MLRPRRGEGQPGRKLLRLRFNCSSYRRGSYDGAVRAVVERRRSLLPAGITAVAGKFHGGDVVELRGLDAVTVARGVVAYDAAELATMIGRSTSDLPADMRRPAVHADDLVAV